MDNQQQEKGFWDYFTPIATGVGSAAITGMYNNYQMNKQNEFNALQAELNREWNAKEAEKNRQFETQMSNTAYQRGYADMASAGLNPHLAGGQGGASTPAGGMGTSTAATSAGMLPLDINGAINAASNAALLKSQINKTEAETTLIGKQTGKTEVETNGMKIDNEYKAAKNQLEILLMQTTNKKEQAEIQRIIHETSKIDKEVAKMDDEIAILKEEGKIKEAEAKTKVRNRRAYAALEMIESGTRSVGNLVGAGAKMAAVGTNAIKAFEM